jgi:hypothetical protein
MKKLITIILTLSPLLAPAQEKERHSRAYLGVMLHDMNQQNIGISLVNSFGVNQYIGLGAGVDLTGYKNTLMVPVYLDLRIKYPIKQLAPFVFGQFGKPLYSNKEDDGINWTDVTGNPLSEDHQKVHGKYFYGGGIGLAYKKSKVGAFITYTQRSYHFFSKKFDINGRTISPKYGRSAGILTAGLVF